MRPREPNYYSHSTPDLFLFLGGQSCVGNKTQCKSQILHIHTVQLRTLSSAGGSSFETFARHRAHVHLRSIEESFSSRSARLSPAERAPAADAHRPAPVAAGASHPARAA